MTGLVLTIIVLTVFMILSFVAPEKSESGFWNTINKIRKVMDTVCYWMLNAFGILTIVLAVLLGLNVIG